MSVINVLDKQTANLIAAGEVVDRPASAAKELLENAIDAGADAITVEIKNGGSTLIRVTDNGKGMVPDDVRLCVLRHATSKISTSKDLDGIRTLGFRGEALAAISSVSRFQIISKTADSSFGICMQMEGENETSFEQVGCPNGTTVTVRDIFFNVPARRKFLKKDQTETAYITQYMERIALSNPNISIKFIVDSKIRFSTSGNGDLMSAVYSVFGKEFSSSLIEVKNENEYEKVKVSGFVSLPDKSRVNRNFQIFYVNGRYVKTRSLIFALEDAYKTYIFNDKYPACVLFIEIDPYLVDVNVHPSKLEVRFVDELAVRQSVYFAVRNTIQNIVNPISADIKDVKYEEKEKELLYFTPQNTTDIKKEQVMFSSSVTSDLGYGKSQKDFSFMDAFAQARPISEPALPSVFRFSDVSTDNGVKNSSAIIEEKLPLKENTVFFSDIPKGNSGETGLLEVASERKHELFYCGNVFNTYIIAEYDSNMYIIDKHAAHERILYEALKSKKIGGGTQMLLESLVLKLSSEEFDVALSNSAEISDTGFDFTEFGPNTVAIKGVPTEFSGFDTSAIEDIFVGMLSDIIIGRHAKNKKEDIFDKALFTAACRAALKGGIPDSEESYKYLLKKISELDNVFCCPHGRPIIVKYTKSQIEKMFFRT